VSGVDTGSAVSGQGRFRAYPEYMDSDVEWLGEAPAHWKVKRLKYVAPLSTDRWRETMADLPYYGLEHIESATGRLASSPETSASGEDERESEGTSSLFRAGDVLFGKLRPYLAKVWKPSFEGRCSTELLVLRGNGEVTAPVLAYQLLSPAFIRWINSMTYGTKMPRANAAQVKGAYVVVAPPREQRAIAAFLDRETAKIDALVAKKERLIELLQEKRAALISHAVTKGLDPSVPMKESGVEWLGEIPAHWMAKHLRWAIMFQRGHDLPTDEREEGQVPIVSSSGISSTHSRAVAKAPGIVTGRYGTIGQFHLITQDYWPLNTTLYSIDLRGNDPRFLLYMLTHLSPLFLLNAVKSAVPGVDRNDIHPTRTAVPPLGEQLGIVAFLDRETAKIDALAAKVREGIERLREYRTALISAAVTGKIDVRGEVGAGQRAGAELAAVDAS